MIKKRKKKKTVLKIILNLLIKQKFPMIGKKIILWDLGCFNVSECMLKCPERKTRASVCVFC